MSHFYGADWRATLREIAGGGLPGAEVRDPPPAGSLGPPADQGRSPAPAGATSPSPAGWQAAASAVALPESEAGEFQELDAEEEREDAFSEGSWIDKSSQELRAMLRHFQPNQDHPSDYEAFLARVASVLAV